MTLLFNGNDATGGRSHITAEHQAGAFRFLAASIRCYDGDEEDDGDKECECEDKENCDCDDVDAEAKKTSPAAGVVNGEGDDEPDEDDEDKDGEDDKPKVAAMKTFEMTAYTGGAMRPMGFGLPVVVDLAGVTMAAESLPVPYSHDLTKIVGHTTSISVKGGKIVLKGVMSGVCPEAKEVAALAANGFPWQASIGAEPDDLFYVDDDTSIECNGQQFTGPLYLARKVTIGEISFVPLGADTNTSARVSAITSKGDNMTFDLWLKARGKAIAGLDENERERLEAAWKAEVGIRGNRTPKTNTVTPTIRSQREQAAAEQERLDAIDASLMKHGIVGVVEFKDGDVKIKGNLKAHAIREGWDAARTEAAAANVALDAIRGGRPGGSDSNPAPRVHIPGTPELTAEVVECAILDALKCRLNDDDFYREQGKPKPGIARERQRIKAEFDRKYPEKVQDHAHRLYKGRVGLHQVLAAGAAMNGHRIGEVIRDDGDLENALHCAFDRRPHGIQADGSSMASLSNVLANVLNKFALQGYWMVEMAWKEISATRSVKDFKATKSINLFGDFEFKDLGPDDELQHGNMKDQAFANQAVTKGLMTSITRANIINDDLGMLSQVPMLMGRGAGLKLNKMFWTKFMNPGYDNGGSTNFFAATHTISGESGNANYFEGAATNLQASSLTSAVVLFDNQVDPNGDPLGVDASILLFPPELETTAWVLLNSEFVVSGNTTKVGNKNEWASRFKPVMSRYLNKSAYTGYSTTAWYLLADPGTIPVIEVAFLNGTESPTIQTAQADFNRLGISIRGFFDAGVNMQNFRGGVKSKGAA